MTSEYKPVAKDDKEVKIVIEDIKEDPKASIWVYVWMGVNIGATIGIVFTNKAIFSNKGLVKMPILFTAFHFLCTSLTLFVLSSFGGFTPKPLSPFKILPLCFAFCGNVILVNLSLAYSSVTFYQLARILVTPACAALNWIIYGVTISRTKASTIIPICLGIGITTYYDSIAVNSQKSTSLWGVFFALTGVTVSAIYVIWIGIFSKRFSSSSMQMLFNQSSWSIPLLLVASPILDSFYGVDEISTDAIFLIFLSGGFAVLINLSQFFIVNGTTALTSTVVGHVKTCAIVSLGWFLGKGMNPMSVVGVFLALMGVFLYSSVKK